MTGLGTKSDQIRFQKMTIMHLKRNPFPKSQFLMKINLKLTSINQRPNIYLFIYLHWQQAQHKNNLNLRWSKQKPLKMGVPESSQNH